MSNSFKRRGDPILLRRVPVHISIQGASSLVQGAGVDATLSSLVVHAFLLSSDVPLLNCMIDSVQLDNIRYHPIW